MTPARPARSSTHAVLWIGLALSLGITAGCSQDEMAMDGPDNPDGGQVGPTPTCTDRAPLGAFDVDVTTVTLNGKITVNGKQPTSQSGSVTLVNRDTGDSVYLGRTGDPNYAQKRVIPGTYDLVYAWSGQGDMVDVPRNLRARLRTGVEIKDSGTLDVDLQPVTLNGKVTINGQVPTANTGTVTLREPKTGDSFFLGRTGDASYAPKLVLPGTYDVHYAWSGQSTNPIDVPRNTAARVKAGVTVSQSGALDVDIPTVTLNGRITVNGQVPMANTGTVTLVNRDLGDSVYLGRTSDMNYSPKQVVPGTYDLVYGWSGQNTNPIDVPRNTAARLRTGVGILQSGMLDVNIPAVTLNGKITVNGQVPMANTGTVTLANAGTGDTLALGRTSDMAYTAKLIVPGTYDVMYSWSGQNTSVIDVPRNSGARVRTGVMVTQAGTLDVDIPAVTLSGKITVNGQVPMANTGTVSLRGGEGGTLSLGPTAAMMYQPKLVVPASYDIYYAWSGQGTGNIDVPRNASARLRSGVVVKESGALDVDIPAVTLMGKVTVDGKTPVSRSGQVFLRNPAQGDSVALGRTGDATYTAKMIVPAPYNIVYNWSGMADPADDVPRNTAALLGCKLLSME